MDFGLMFEVLMYLNSYYYVIYAFSEAMTFCFKVALADGLSPYNKLTNKEPLTDVGVFTALCFIEIFRIYLGRKGENYSEKPLYIVCSLLLIIPSSVSVFYFLYWQSNVVRLEIMLNSFQLIMASSEMCFGIAYLISFFRRARY